MMIDILRRRKGKERRKNRCNKKYGRVCGLRPFGWRNELGPLDMGGRAYIVPPKERSEDELSLLPTTCPFLSGCKENGFDTYKFCICRSFLGVGRSRISIFYIIAVFHITACDCVRETCISMLLFVFSHQEA